MEHNAPCAKVKFASEDAALEFIAAKVRSSKKKKFVSVNAYLCEFCLTWHITSNEFLFKKDFNIQNEIFVRDKKIGELEEKIKLLVEGDYIEREKMYNEQTKNTIANLNKQIIRLNKASDYYQTEFHKLLNKK